MNLNPAKLKLSVTLPKLKFPLASLLQEPTTTVIQPLEDEKQDTALSPQSQEIMNKLDSKFYEDKTKFNATEYVLAMLPEQLDEKWFDEQLAAKESALNVVNSQLFKKVMANYESFVQGMTHIHELGLDLSTSGVVCKNGRRNLRTAKEQLTDRVAVIVAKYRKRQTYKEISDILTGIKKLVTADRQFGQSVEEGDFPKAIESVLECRSVVGQYKQYQSVVDLMNTLQDKYNVVQSKLDTALYEACRNFTDLGYQRILIAYRLLGQSGSVLERLQKYFIEAINTHTKNAIYAHVLIKEENSLKAELYKKKKFRELCEVLPGEHFFICLQTVLEILTDIMYGHYLMSQWHAQATAENTTNDESMKKYLDDIKDGLSKIKPTVWDNMQRKVSILISTTSTVADFQIDDFLKVLDSLNRFVEIGEEFTQTEAHTLRGSIKLQSREYFKNFHKTNIESLWTMLENEMWQRCPVSKNFIADSYLKEFNNFYRPEPNKSSKRSIFSTMKTLGNPFSRTTKLKQEDSKTNKPILVPEEDEDLLDVDEIDEETGELKSNVAKDSEGPLVTTTTINVIRFIGKYIMMMKVLQPIAYEIFMGITQIWEYYIYSVYNTFGENPSASSGISPKLKYLISKLYQHFNHNPMESPESDSNSVLVTKVKLPKLNSMLEVTNPNNLFGISVRTVAVESIMMLEECLKLVKPHIGNAMPKARERNFNEFYLNTVDAVPELVKYITKTLALKFINWSVFLQHMNVARWQIKEVSTEQNSYVEFLLKEFQMMGRKLNRELKAGTLPTRVRNYIWEVSMTHLMEQLVDSYASIRTCTSEGRTSMSLDFKVLVNGLEKLSPIKPIPMVSFVDTFIKAYYLGDNEFGQWCKDHQEYSIKQMTSIMNLAPALTNSNKKQFTYIIEQVDKLKQPLPSNMPNTPMNAPSQSAFGASASTWFGAITGATAKKY